MPFVKLLTNLPKDKLPLQLMPILCEKLASTLEKDLKAFNWILETDKNMSKGPNISFSKSPKKLPIWNFQNVRSIWFLKCHFQIFKIPQKIANF